MYKSPFTLSMTLIMLMSSLMAMSSSNWLMIWLALEINLMSFIPLILLSTKFQETEATIKYFMAQAIGSSLLLLSSMSLWSFDSIYQSLNPILLMSLTMKIGMFPCHFWFTSVMNSISWTSALLLSTWQKLAPLSIISFSMLNMKHPMMVLAMLNALTGGIMGLNQSQLRTIMAYSSITHLGWMSALISMNLPLYSMLYFMFYTILITPMFIMFNKSNTTMVNQLSKNMSMSPSWIMMMSMLFLSLGGLPPLLGFLPKLMSVILIMSKSIIMLLVLITGSLCNLYFYLNIVFSTMLNQPNITPSTKHQTKLMPMLTILSLSSLWAPMMMMI